MAQTTISKTTGWIYATITASSDGPSTGNRVTVKIAEAESRIKMHLNGFLYLSLDIEDWETINHTVQQALNTPAEV